MSTARFFLGGILLALLGSGAVLAGQYQRATDDKTLVWNENHKAGESVSWSGKRDADGYATGYGTLTWYAAQDGLEVGSKLPRKHNRILSRVSGTMVHGKFEQAPSQATPPATAESAKPKKRGWLSSIFRFGSKSTPAPVEPTPKPRRRLPATHTEATAEEETPTPTDAAVNAKPTPSPSAASQSLGESMNAPSSLKLSSPAASATPEVTVRPEETASPSPTP